jgi:hypothetical protein
MKMLRSVLASLVRHDIGWFFLKPISRLGSYLLTERNRLEDAIRLKEEQERNNGLFHSLFKDRVVLHGPFQGLTYPAMIAAGSSLFPKLLGSYERELHPIVELICETPYTQIINVGCGEGYYAVGLARRIPTAQVVAFDVEENARRATKEMAITNHVSDRVRIGGWFGPEDLARFSFNGRSLLVCDCEGYEHQLLTASTLDNLRETDILVETHDFIDIRITNDLKKLFSATHNLQVIKSVDDIEKAKTYPYTEAMSFDLVQRKLLFREGRPAIMEWFFLTPKREKLSGPAA